MPQNRDLPPGPAHQHSELPPAKILTRMHVARMLRCSIANVRKLEKTGKLKPIIDRQGVRRFERTQVEIVCRERLREGFRTGGIDGELAAEVFSYFRNQMPFADIVIKTHASPEAIRMLWDEYKRPLGAPPASESAKAMQDDLDASDARSREIDDTIMARRARRAAG
jgi:hypothetical protein